MKILVTGATGFLGRAIVGELLQNNFEVFTTGKSAQADLPNYFPADLTDSESLSALEKIGRIDAIIHSAGLAHQFGKTSREIFRKVNVEGTRNILDLAAKLNAGKFILISSVSVYGRARQAKPETVFEENLPCQPQGFYAESKLEAEKIAARICADNAIDLTILRPSTIVGENDRGNVARLIEAVDRRRFVWVGDGKNAKSLIYKTDVARACLLFLENSVAAAPNNKTNIYNVTAEPVSMREIVGEMEKALDRRVLPIRIPVSPLRKSLHFIGKASGSIKLRKYAETLDKWLSDDVFSGEKIRREIGFLPLVSPLEGIRREALHYRNRK
ncbi:MAG: SDR family NAD(P)-dependent oxidoreductase [Acidobacteriota bacterium]|nr:SDR family NAD(P)-dependent oxidoreductase [Acidobacteriota bacterium]